MKFKDYITYWHSTYRAPRQSKNTAAGIQASIRVHIESSKLGNMDISNIDVSDIQAFLTELLISGNKSKIFNMNRFGQPLAKSTVNKIRQIIIAAMQQAVKEKIISINPALDTEIIPVRTKPANFFSFEAQQEFLEHTKNHRFHAAYLLMFYTGLRRGEVLGLSWNNINFKRNYVFISQILTMEEGKPVLYKNHAKTSRSIRLIPIPAQIKKEILLIRSRQKEEKKDCPDWSNPDGLVFCNKDGSPHNPNYFTRNFKNTLIRMGLPSDLHLHSTRHTWATNMVQLGIPLSDIQALGGWSRPDVLLRIYAHTLQESQKKAINKLWKQFNNNPDK